MSETHSIEFHPSQYPLRVKARLLDALRARRLPARFLYDSPAQAARWLAYHAAWSPSRTEASLLELYDEAFDRALDASAAELTYVSLGCGGGTKDARFMAKARARGVKASPVLSDTSPSLVLEALLKISGSHDRSARGLVVDLEAAPERSAFANDASAAVLTAFGMVPNLEHGPFLTWLAGQLRPSDVALVSANLHPEPWPQAGPAILPQYDNPEARAWYEGALAELGLSDAKLIVEGVPLHSTGRAWQVRIRAEPVGPVSLRVFDQTVHLSSDEPLEVFFSNRFTPDAFSRALETSGLRIEARMIFDGGEEGIWVVRSANPDSTPR